MKCVSIRVGSTCMRRGGLVWRRQEDEEVGIGS